MKNKNNMTPKKYYMIYKGYNVLSQFSKDEKSALLCLRDIYPNIEKDVYPIGRLDGDSEGLLILYDHPLLIPCCFKSCN